MKLKYIILIALFISTVFYVLTSSTSISNYIAAQVNKRGDRPWAPKAHYYIAMYPYHMNETGQAMALYEALAKNYPDSEYAIGAEFMIARIYDRQNNTGRARELYREFLKKHGDSRWADNARQRLKFLELPY